MSARRFSLRTDAGVEDLGIFDERKFKNSDGYLIQNVTGGYTIREFFTKISDLDPKALQALVWFLRFKRGEQIRFEDVDFNVLDLEAEDVVPDPTPVPAGTAETAISEPSPSTSA